MSSTPPEVSVLPCAASPGTGGLRGQANSISADPGLQPCSHLTPAHSQHQHLSLSHSSAPITSSPRLCPLLTLPPPPGVQCYRPQGWPHILTWQVPTSLHFWGVGLAWRPGPSWLSPTPPSHHHRPWEAAVLTHDWEPIHTQTSTVLPLLGLPQPSPGCCRHSGSAPVKGVCSLAHALRKTNKKKTKPLCLGSLKPGFHTLL